MENKLPQGWIECSLGDILSAKKGKKPKSVIQSPRVGYVPYILIDEMEGKPIRTYTNDPKVSIIDATEVLLVWDGSIGKCGSGLNGAIGSTLVGLKASGGIQTNFLEYTIQQQNNFIKETSTGTGLQHINKDFFKICKIPLPPLIEQRRIAAKLDALMQKVESNKQRLNKIPKLLKRFRQSALAAAVSGDLTEEWRIKNKDFTNAKTLYIAIRNSNDFKEYGLNSEDLEKFAEIPTSWVYAPIGNISSFQQGMQIAKSTRKKEFKENCLPILRIKNYTDGFKSDVEYCVIDENTLIAEKEDIILARTGETRGKVLTGYKGVFHNNCFRINYSKEHIERDYLIYYLKSSAVQEFIVRNSNNTGQPDLTHKSFGPCPFAIPPREEQKEIIRITTQLFAFADTIEARYTKAEVMLDKLPQCILAKAFRGELVPQDANDEPASVLLERIKAEKESSEQIKKLKRK